MSAHDHASSDDDSAPEAVSFETSKTENVEHLQRVKEQVNQPIEFTYGGYHKFKRILLVDVLEAKKDHGNL